jgi:2-methylcitrate dehydratase PrpD
MAATRTPLEAYGQWLADTPAEWPGAAIVAAQNGFIDTLGVATRGARETVVARVLASVRGWGEGRCRIIGEDISLPAPHAALVNGTAAHALDFDDNFDPAKAHASAVLVPTILAIADQVQASGADCIDAYIAGLQIMGRIGDGVNPAHRRRGWHGTATIGTFGAAAAAARMMRLDARQCAHALSLASSRAGGFISQFGTMAKPVHAGLAAQSGIIAASLAAGGIEAALNVLEGPTGLTGLMVSAAFDATRENAKGFVTGDIGAPLMVLDPAVRPKRFPNCGSAHRAMDALLILGERHNLATLRTVTVHAPQTHLRNLMFVVPQSNDEAKFSLEYALAVLMADGNCALTHFEGDAWARPDLVEIAKRIVRVPFADDDMRATQVVVELANGGTDEEAVLWAAGSKAKPFSTPQYWQKFDLCTTGTAHVEPLRHCLQQLPVLEKSSQLTEALAHIRHPSTASGHG